LEKIKYFNNNYKKPSSKIYNNSFLENLRSIEKRKKKIEKSKILNLDLKNQYKPNDSIKKNDMVKMSCYVYNERKKYEHDINKYIDIKTFIEICKEYYNTHNKVTLETIEELLTESIFDLMY
jgi:hypothetical protein